MIILGITGGIGSGKSYISSLLREQLNVPVYDCDSEAKRLMGEDKDGDEQQGSDIMGKALKARTGSRAAEKRFRGRRD